MDRVYFEEKIRQPWETVLSVEVDKGTQAVNTYSKDVSGEAL